MPEETTMMPASGSVAAVPETPNNLEPEHTKTIDTSSIIDWRQDLPEDIRNLEEVKTSDTPGKFLDQFVNLKSLIGRSLRIPGPDATAEARDAFHDEVLTKVPGLMATPDNDEARQSIFSKMGKPEEAVGYKVPEVSGANTNDDQMGKLKQMAHDADMTQSQFNTFIEPYLQAQATEASDTQHAFETQLSSLRQEWGMAFESKFKVAEAFAKQMGANEAIMQQFADGKVAPDTLRFLDGVVKQFGTEKVEIAAQPGTSNYISPSEARSQAQEILYAMDKEPQGSPKYNQLHEKRMNLMKMAHGEL